MTSDILNSIKATLHDRISNPLFGSFIASWVIWNYRFIWVLFSSKNFDEKFKYIDMELFSDDAHKWLFLIAGPLTTALLYLYAYPFVGKKVYEHHQTKQKELKEIKQKIEDETPLTQKESRKLRAEIRVLEIKHQEEVDVIKQRHSVNGEVLAELNAEKISLQTKLESAQNEFNEINSDHEEIIVSLKRENKMLIDSTYDHDEIDRKEQDFNYDATIDDDLRKKLRAEYGLDDVQYDVIKYLATALDPTTMTELLSIYQLPKSELYLLLEGLSEKGYVKIYQTARDGDVVELTSAGNKIAIKHDLVAE